MSLTLQQYAGLAFYQERINITEQDLVRGDSMQLWIKYLPFGQNLPNPYTVTNSSSAATSGATSLTLASISEPVSGETYGTIYRGDVLNFPAGFAIVSADTFLGTDPGTGFTVGTITLSSGSVATIPITAGGSGYTVPPIITLSAPTSGVTATANAFLTNGVVTGILITNPGSGYGTTPPTATIAAVSNLTLPILPLIGSVAASATTTSYLLNSVLFLTEGGVVDTQGQEMTSRVKAQSLFQTKAIQMRNATLTANGTLLKGDPSVQLFEQFAQGGEPIFFQARHAPFQSFVNGYSYGTGPAARQGVGFVQNFQPQSAATDFVKVQATISVSGSHQPYVLLS